MSHPSKFQNYFGLHFKQPRWKWAPCSHTQAAILDGHSPRPRHLAPRSRPRLTCLPSLSQADASLPRLLGPSVLEEHETPVVRFTADPEAAVTDSFKLLPGPGPAVMPAGPRLRSPPGARFPSCLICSPRKFAAPTCRRVTQGPTAKSETAPMHVSLGRCSPFRR